MAFRQSSNSTFQHQPCDSYFVESYEDNMFATRANAKERLRLIARERQLAIAEEMSRMVSEEYQDDILKHMTQMEVKHTNHLINYSR